MEIPSYKYSYFLKEQCREIGIGKPDVLLIEQCFEQNGLESSELVRMFKMRPNPRHQGIDARYCIERTCQENGLIVKREGKWHASQLGLDQVTRVEYRNERRRWYGLEEDDWLVNFRFSNAVTKRHFWDYGIDYIQTRIVRNKVSVPCLDRSPYVPIEFLHVRLIECLSDKPMSTRQAWTFLQDYCRPYVAGQHILEQCRMDGTLQVDVDGWRPTTLGQSLAAAALEEAERRTNLLRQLSITREIPKEFVLQWGSDWWWDDESSNLNGDTMSLQVNNRARNRLVRLWRRWIDFGMAPDDISSGPA